MPLLKPSNIFQLLLIFFLSLFRNRFAKKIRFILQKKLQSSSKIFISINDSRVDRFNSFRIKSFYFRYANILIIGKGELSCKFSLFRLFKKQDIRELFHSFYCDFITIVVLPISNTNSDKNAIPFSKLQSVSFQLNRIINILKKNQLGKVDIGYIAYVNTTQNLEIDLQNFLLEAYYQLATTVSLRYKNLLFTTSIKTTQDLAKTLISVIATNANLYSEFGRSFIDFQFAKLDIARYNTDTSFRINILVDNVRLVSSYISDYETAISKIEGELILDVDNNNLYIKRESIIELDGISFSIEVSYSMILKNQINFKFIVLIDAECFFTHFPFIKNSLIKEIKSTGNLLIELQYVHALLKNLRSMFTYRILENSISIHKLPILPQFDLFYFPNKVYKNYIPADCIPRILKEVIIINEDPNFYTHNGIDNFFIALSMDENIRQKKIVKGASTITMQLARNLFLNHRKNFSRKIEEIIFSLLIENWYKISKERIFELYLNIIEFAPKVYGISDASLYYFEKKVRDLNLTECLVISYIVPRPKFFLEAVLMKSPRLIKNLSAHIKIYSSILINKKLIDQAEYDGITSKIQFKSSIGILELMETN